MAKRVKTRKQNIHQTSESTKRSYLTNRVLLFVLIGLTALMIAALAINILRIRMQKSTTTEASEEETTETINVDTGKSMRNDLYVIGNNPTDIQQEYFQQLTDALKSGDGAAIAEAVVYNFVSDYFTWTNKDGNYEVGGLQYIYAPDVAGFEQWSRYNFYKDLDLYISQEGRDKLMEVASITTEKATEKAPDFSVITWDDPETKKELTYESYEVNVNWTYANAKDADRFPTGARFFVINNEGRYEIAEFYDIESIHEWEAKQSEAKN